MTYRKCTFPLRTVSLDTNLAKYALEKPSLISVALMNTPCDQMAKRLAKHPTSNGFLNVHQPGYSSMVLFPAFAPVVNGKSTWSAKPARQHPSVEFPSEVVDVNVLVKSINEENIIDILASIATNFTDVRDLELNIQDRNICQAGIASFWN